LITANQTFSDWDAIFADATMTVAAIDRLVHHPTIIEIQTGGGAAPAPLKVFARKPP